MKVIKKLKLSEFSKQEMENRQLKSLKGGDWCTDKCGTSTSSRSGTANAWYSYFYD